MVDNRHRLKPIVAEVIVINTQALSQGAQAMTGAV